MDLSKIKQYADRLKQEVGGLDRKIIAKATGVSFDGRQELIAQLKKETPIKLERDRRNRYDPYAINILAKLNNEWKQVGFIPKKMSREISRSLDSGNKLTCSIHRVIGGGTFPSGEPINYGLEIIINPN